MNKLITLGIIAVGFNLGLSAEIHTNVVIKQLPVEVQEELGQNEHIQHVMLGQVGPRTLSIGQSAEIKLSSNPSTGFSWRSTCTPEQSLEISSKFENGKSNGMVGVGGSQIFTITAKRAGNVSCTFEYGRAWDESTYKKEGNSKTYSFKITE